jgi:hypothetical protein
MASGMRDPETTAETVKTLAWGRGQGEGERFLGLQLKKPLFQIDQISRVIMVISGEF